jgi:cytochrome bd-type quinol oxidase subunit 2
VNTQIATEAERPRARRSARSLLVLSLGPLTVLAGIVWALAQPYRVTLLHPHGQGFWWLFVQPPLWVIAAGLAFHALVAPGVVADLEEAEP